MTSNNTVQDKAGHWLRVSSGGQDEQSQLPEVAAWSESHGYTVTRTYTVHGKSAFKGNKRFDETWARVLDDMRLGRINVLVVWKQDRLDRKLNTFQMLAQVVEAGGRVEFVTQPHLNDLTTMGGRIALKVQEEIAHAESKDKADRIRIKHNALRVSGSVIGRASWGLTITKQDGRKVLEPTDDGAKYVPVIFDRVIAGESRLSLAAWLDAENVATPNGGRWSENSVGHIIRNPVYMGQRRNAGALETPALVSSDVWQAANAALTNRIRHGRGTTKQAKALLSPICGDCYGQEREGCPNGISPMYRTAKDGKSYYRCWGSGAQRKGCGLMVPVVPLDAYVRRIIARMTSAHVASVFVAGDMVDKEIKRLRARAAQQMLAEDDDAVTATTAEIKRLESAPRRKAHYEQRVTDQSEADYFAGLDDGSQREYLARWDVLPVAVKGGRFTALLGAPWETDTGEDAVTVPGARKTVSPWLVARLAKLHDGS